jgi:8-oxo-dGTP pyrophosphatase MutT (NUDIX family)
MTWKPNATVAVICEREGRFLVVEEMSDGELVINQPAGHIEKDELILDAALRETLEETGWEVSISSFMGLFTYTSALNGVTYYRFCFAAEAIRQISQTYDTGIIQPLWLTRDELIARAEQHRSPLVIECVDAFIAGHFYPLSLINEKNRFSTHSPKD